MNRTMVRAGGGALISLFAMTAPAMAATYKIAEAGGSAVYVWNSSSSTNYRSLYVKDNKADSRSVYGNWSNNGATGRLNNYSGAYNTVYKDTGAPITALRACVNVPLNDDVCSGWK